MGAGDGGGSLIVMDTSMGEREWRGWLIGGLSEIRGERIDGRYVVSNKLIFFPLVPDEKPKQARR